MRPRVLFSSWCLGASTKFPSQAPSPGSALPLTLSWVGVSDPPPLPTLVGRALPGCPGVRGGSPWYQESCFVNRVPRTCTSPAPPTSLPASIQLRPSSHACWATASQELTSMRRPGRSSQSPAQAPAPLAVTHTPPTPTRSFSAPEGGHCPWYIPQCPLGSQSRGGEGWGT